MLRWWHTALSLFSTWWSNGSCTDLRLPGGYLGMDERTSPTAQPGKDWASCLSCRSDSTALFHDSVGFINNYTINLEILVWSLMTSWPSKSTLQRLLDLAGLHFTTSESGPFWQSMLHNFLSRPLSFLDWTTAMLFWLDFHQAQSNLYKWSECSGTTGLQWAKKSPCYTSLCLLALATSCSSHQVQDTDACI